MTTNLRSFSSSFLSGLTSNSSPISEATASQDSLDTIIAYKDQDLSTSLRVYVPDLTESFYLYINPQNMNWSFGAKRQEVSNNLGGIIESNFPDGLDSLSISGYSGVFVTQEEGYAAVDRSSSLVYQKTIKFLDLLRNNASHYDEFGVILNVNKMIVSYLGLSWAANVKSFSYNEQQDQPTMLEINADFIIHTTKGVL